MSDSSLIAHPSSLLFFGEHALDRLRQMASESVHCIVTSPPYWGLRNYGTEPQLWPDPAFVGAHGDAPACPHLWGNAIRGKSQSGSLDGSTLDGAPPGKERRPEWDSSFCSFCGAWRGELGLEPTPELYVQHLTLLFHECFRVVRSDGTLWLNIGDTYATTPVGRFNQGGFKDKSAMTGGRDLSGHEGSGGLNKLKASGLKPKDLVGIPWMVAFALRADGWYLRQEIIWHKPNPMPESLTDRCTKSHESIFLFSKSERYFYDHLAIAEPSIYADSGRKSKKRGEFDGKGCAMPGREPFRAITQSRNRRSVWTIPTVPYPEAHYAVFPPEIPRLCILAGTSAHGCCPQCSAPWQRIVEPVGAHGDAPASHKGCHFDSGKTADHQLGRASSAVRSTSQTVGWQPTCSCRDDSGLIPPPSSLIPSVVLDPFAGSGTTLQVATELGRNYIGIELDEKNRTLCEHRLARTNRTLNMDV